MYYSCLVKVSEDAIKEFLTQFYDEEEVEDMTEYKLQNEATEAIQGILSDHFSDYYVIDDNTVVVGDLD